MKIHNFIILTTLTLCSLAACNKHSGQNSKNGQSAIDSTTNGEKKVFYPDGKIKYLAEFKNGKANGRVREYTPDGKLYMDALFVDGHRNGKCTHFYKSGNPFEISDFVNGEKDGIESKFYDNGKLLATIIYKKNKVQPGLKEYKRDGTEVDNENTLVISEVDQSARKGKYFFQITLLKSKNNVDFYASPQSDPETRQKLQLIGNAGILEIPVKSRNFTMKNLIFEAEYKTNLGNTMRLQKLYHHSVK